MSQRDPRIFMWAQAVELLDKVERMHRQSFSPVPAASAKPGWQPPVDVFETEGEYRICVALPGVHKDQLDVLLDGRTLVVVGERSFPVEHGEAALVHRLELPYGRFERRIELPPTVVGIGRRELVDGCLLVVLHKA